MSVQEELELHEYIKKYQATLGCAELKRRGRLLREATELMGRLTKRAATFARVDPEQFQRSTEALRRANRRTERRERAYYGA